LFGTSNFILLSSLLAAHINEGFLLVYEKELPFHYCYICFTCFILFIGVIGKSAQIGLHTWLPAAIEGPTPVSALIHAATIVTAGVFLILRLSFVFYYSYHIQVIIIIIGCLTALISAITAFFLYDIKKIIAYSTCSQLGYIVVAGGLLQFNYALFHLINHAFFKALLFLTAGAIIHSFNNEQDIRRYSNIFVQMPFIYTCIIIGNIAIIGLPFLSGFYSKDLIIEFAYLNRSINLNCNVIFIFLLVATSFTAAYSLRLYYYLFLRSTTLLSTSHKYLNQAPILKFVLSLLASLSVLSGYLLQDLFQLSINFFLGENFSRRYLIDLKLSSAIIGENEFLPLYIKLLPLILNVGVWVGLYIIVFHSTHLNFRISTFFLHIISPTIIKVNPLLIVTNQVVKNITNIIRNNFYFNEFYNFIAIMNFYYYFHFILKNVDKGFLELAGPFGFTKVYSKCVLHAVKLYEHSLRQFLFIIYNTFVFYYFVLEYFII
jgi:NADH:ubiquinone oxidoreductase subunit 5 (subunit L)/multisubunit Na+/H+ antiporter MnhA subunit